MSNRYAVMGCPVSHSLSPKIHQAFAGQTSIQLEYEKLEVPESQLVRQIQLFFDSGGKGLNITLPFKEKAYALAEVRTARCEQAKAANTLWMEKGRLCADNTDGVGLLRDLTRHVDLKAKKVLLLGAGGAARGVLGALLAASVETLTLTNRSMEKALVLQGDFPKIHCLPPLALEDNYDVVIDATSAGTRKEAIIWPERILKTAGFCYDLSYQIPGETAFLCWAKQHDRQAIDGLGMLVEQAAESFFIWHGVFPHTEGLVQALR